MSSRGAALAQGPHHGEPAQPGVEDPERRLGARRRAGSAASTSRSPLLDAEEARGRHHEGLAGDGLEGGADGALAGAVA